MLYGVEIVFNYSQKLMYTLITGWISVFMVDILVNEAERQRIFYVILFEMLSVLWF
jgi:hypothetical protein